jgi:hypothetical protein
MTEPDKKSGQPYNPTVTKKAFGPPEQPSYSENCGCLVGILVIAGMLFLAWLGHLVFTHTFR